MVKTIFLVPQPEQSPTHKSWSPHVKVTHGLTSESSNLLYIGESGGLNEAYSDIMGCALEFAIDDDIDKPDFLVGESLVGPAFERNFLRSMETPSDDGESIDTYCDREYLMPVHFSSGFLNRAFVNAVKSCESICNAGRAHCVVLMADIFMYTNLEILTSASGFIDAAKMTCTYVPEFYLAREPKTKCTAEHGRTAVVAGFAAVGLEVNTETCDVTVTCDEACFFVRTFIAVKNFLELGYKLIFRNVF
jgi:Zn-dependent metalloprotease